MIVDYKDMGARIRTLRKAAKMTQEDLAEQVGISASFMGHLERGSRIASLETLVALCNVLDVTPEYLLSASLNTFERHMPSSMSPADRLKLGEFLRLAQDTIKNWNE